MSYNDEFLLFWKQVKDSIEQVQFAKLTMAKTIGKPNLRNIYVRPLYLDNEFKALLKYHYRSRETEDKEEEYTLEEVFPIIYSHLKSSFFSVVLFTTTKDVTFKINKKGAASIIESPPSFKEIPTV